MPKRPDPPRLWRNVFYPLPNYNYFEMPPEFDKAPMAGKLNLLKAAWMADASMLAYGRSGPDVIPPDRLKEIFDAAGFQFELLGDWSPGKPGTQGYFAYTSDFAVLAFRGTEKDDWKDVLADLVIWPVAKIVEQAAAGHTESVVHRGFQNALNEVWEQAHQKLVDYRARTQNEIFFTGHSLGAALATLAISRYAGENTSLYTFGLPRCGNSVFAGNLGGRATLGQYRFVDYRDIVTRVPPALFGFSHGAGNLYLLNEAGVLEDHTGDAGEDAGGPAEVAADLKVLTELRFPIGLDTTPPGDIYDHSPGRYCNRLWSLLP
jgi:triacylglycerol lipase